MGTPNPGDIERLVQQGLDHYGTGDVGRAVACWREALALDPDHAEAQEYLQTALEDSFSGGEAPPASPRPVLEEAQRLLADDAEAALELLEGSAAEHPDDLELQGYVEMVRSRLLKQYREKLLVDSAFPRQCLSPELVMSYNLPPDAGFLLSLVDGTLGVKDLISICGMDEFRALRILTRLIEAGIVEMRT